jgi:serpin B
VRTAVGNATGIGASAAQGLPTLSARDRQMTSSARSGSISLEIANAVWPDSSVQLAPEFTDAEQRDADAPARRLDLTSSAAARTINAWVDQATHGHIPALLDGPPSGTRNAVAVTNALYFKGAWKDPFDPQLTSRQPFHRPGALDRTVDLMSKEDIFTYRDEPEFQAVELYFGSNAGFALEIVLPKRVDIDPAMLIESAGAHFLDTLQGNGHINARGTVMLPHLDISETLHPIELLDDSEAVRAIRQPGALNRMFETPPKDLDLQSIQKVVMKLDEKGAAAAASTEVAISASVAAPVPLPIAPFEFRADHPFWFALRERDSGTVLMTGIVRQP